MPRPKSDLEIWAPVALADPGGNALSLSVPVHLLLGEAVDTAKFHAKYWDGVDGAPGVKRPGLSSAVKKKQPNGLSAKTGANILGLQRACSEASNAHMLATEALTGSPRERAVAVLSEMTATLEWFFDDGVEDDHDAKLAALHTEHHEDPETNDALAKELEDYAGLSDTVRADIDGLGGFDAKQIDEARALAQALRDRPTTTVATTEKAKAAVSLRNRLMRLLQAEMTTVRAAAKFVFRAQPEIAREAASAYERRRRAASARKAAKAKEPKKDG